MGIEIENNKSKHAFSQQPPSLSIATPIEPSTNIGKKRRPQRISQVQNKRPSPTQPLPDELGTYIARDVALLNELGWEEFVMRRRD